VAEKRGKRRQGLKQKRSKANNCGKLVLTTLAKAFDLQKRSCEIKAIQIISFSLAEKVISGRGGSGLIFSGSGRARVVAFGLGHLKFKTGLEAFKSRALIMGLKICKKLKIL
jgi:hypothetical protein